LENQFPRGSRNESRIKKRLLEIELDFCEICNYKPPSFMRTNGNDPLHLHHIKPYKLGGSDSLINRIYLCPNCHSIADYLARLSDVYHKRPDLFN